MNHIIMAIATGMYIGKIPRFPGTCGSLAAFLPWLLLKELPLAPYLVVVVLVFWVGFFAAGSAEKLLDTPDAAPIVIDEIVGMFITLILAPPHPVAWLAGFFLFRLFDIFKPFPVSWFDKNIHGGLGIMMDDAVAGIYALLSLQLIWHLGKSVLS